MTKQLKIIFLVFFLITVASIVAVFVMAHKLKSSSGSSPGQETATVAEIKKVVADVGKHIVLPEGETPTMATVSDPDKLKDQPFFAHAQQGDLVLVYAVSRKAILWRPSTEQIIEVSSINLSSPAAPSPNTPAPITSPQVVPTKSPASKSK